MDISNISTLIGGGLAGSILTIVSRYLINKSYCTVDIRLFPCMLDKAKYTQQCVVKFAVRRSIKKLKWIEFVLSCKDDFEPKYWSSRIGINVDITKMKNNNFRIRFNNISQGDSFNILFIAKPIKSALTANKLRKDIIDYYSDSDFLSVNENISLINVG